MSFLRLVVEVKHKISIKKRLLIVVICITTISLYFYGHDFDFNFYKIWQKYRILIIFQEYKIKNPDRYFIRLLIYRKYDNLVNMKSKVLVDLNTFF